MILGMLVQSVLAGKTSTIISERRPYGNMIIIETSYKCTSTTLCQEESIPEDNSLSLLYAHLQDLPTQEIGQLITCRQTIGAVSITGLTSGPICI